MFKSSSSSAIEEKRAPRIMLIAGQNETVRKNPTQEDSFVATVGLFGCVALIIADKNGNVSLTHVDSDTDLSFIVKEIALMEGEFTINIAKGPGPSKLDLKVLSQLKEYGLSHIKHSGSSKVITSEERTIMYNHVKGVPQGFSFSEFYQLSTPGYTPGKENRLFSLGYSVQTCAPNPHTFQLRTYIRQLNIVLSSKRCVPPLLVHDSSGWIETPSDLDEEAKATLSQPSKEITFFSPLDKDSFKYVYPRYLAILKTIEDTSSARSSNSFNRAR